MSGHEAGPGSGGHRYDVTSIGETMLRLSVPAGRRLEAGGPFDVHAGGAESNVCAALAGLGRRTAWFGNVTDKVPGRVVMRSLRAAGIDAAGARVVRDGRMGVYYVELAESPLSTRVTYDRQDSVGCHLSAADIDWESLLDTKVLHLSGITPALSDTNAEMVKEAIRRANSEGVDISFDVNYRSLLWSPDRARGILRDLIKDVDLVMCSRRDAELLTATEEDDRKLIGNLRSMTRAERVVMSVGAHGILAWDGLTYQHQAAFPVRCVDRLGAGDAMAAGVLDGWLDDSFSEGLRRGAALAAVAMSLAGDMVTISREVLEDLSGLPTEVRR